MVFGNMGKNSGTGVAFTRNPSSGVDEFYGDNHGLILAEIELGSEDQLFTKPDWVGKEVSHNERYFNTSLASRRHV